MEQINKDMQGLLKMLDAKEKKRRRNAILYLFLPILAAIALTFWSARQAYILKIKARESLSLDQKLQSSEKELSSLQNEIYKVRTQLKNTRGAIEFIGIGINSFQMKNYPDAIHAYDKAIELDPENPVVYNLKGYSLLRNGEFQKAVDSLKRSIEIDPTYIWGHYNLALAYWAVGDRSKAVAEVKMVIELDPSFRYIIKMDGQFNKFKVLPEYRNLIEKIKANQAVTLATKKPEFFPS